MSSDPEDTRFHGWLATRDPGPAPRALLARAMSDLEREPRAAIWAWPIPRPLLVGGSVAGVLVLATAAALVFGTLSPRSLPVADATASATPTAWQSETGEPSAPGTASALPSSSPRPSIASEAPTTSAEPTAAPSTPMPTPTRTPAPTLVPSSPGTLTVRLHVTSAPPAGARLGLYVATDPAAPRYNQEVALCPRDSEPCAIGTYVAHLSGLAPGTMVLYAVGDLDASGNAERGFSDAAGHVADGSIIDLDYPSLAPMSGSATFRLRLAAIPAGTQSYVLYFPHGESLADRYELCGPATSACGPGRYERTFTDLVPRYYPFVHYALERTTTAGDIRITNAGVAASDGPVIEITNPPDGPGPVASSTNAACAPLAGEYGSFLGAAGWGGGNVWSSFTAPADLCVSLLTLGASTSPGIGTITLTVDGSPVFRVDAGRWTSYGVDGASSGERDVRLATPTWIAAGQTVAVDYAACVSCGTVSVRLTGGAP